MSLSGKKTVLITGCSDGGIGAAMAKVFLEEGYHVFATLRNASKVGTLAGLSNLDILELEVTSEDSIARCAEQVRERTGGTLDILINNAGRAFHMPLLDVDIKEAKKFYDVNFWSVLAMTQAFAPMVVNAKGVVVNHSSVVSNLAIAWGGMYSSSRAAVRQLSEVMRVELEPLGVRVVTAVIGGVDTPLYANATQYAFNMPPDSYYKPVRQFIEDTRAGKKQPRQEPVDVTARHLVEDIISGAKGCIWHGATAGSCKWLSTWLPLWLLDRLNNGTRGLTELRKIIMQRVHERGNDT
ncbi:putative short-chain dehydrogenase/reductase [Hypoxylon sp. FL0543]|nr:putative short-chain dehydrogenase/reductase [Hypoxylon sp. FL0543]